MWRGNRLRDSLANLGFIRMIQFPTGRRGGRITIVEITRKGFAFLQSIRAQVRELRGRGGFLHRVGQLWIRQWYERHYPGCDANIEEEVENKRRVDVGVRVGDSKIGVELLINGVDKESQNIQKVLTSGRYTELVLVATDERKMGKLKELAMGFEEQATKKGTLISFKLLGEFLPERLS